MYPCIHSSIYLSIHSSICSLSFLFIQAKCEQYWPERLNETLETSSHISVKLVEIMRFADFEKKIFHIVNVTFLIMNFVHCICYVSSASVCHSLSLLLSSSSSSSSSLFLFVLLFFLFLFPLSSSFSAHLFNPPPLLPHLSFLLPLFPCPLHTPTHLPPPPSSKTTEEHTSPIEVTHWQFLAWPDHGVPYYAASFISFIRHFRKNHSKHGPPILVHCSAGVGRTGTFIVLDSMLERLRDEDTINVYEFVSQMRSKRQFMVQTLVSV